MVIILGKDLVKSGYMKTLQIHFIFHFLNINFSFWRKFPEKSLLLIILLLSFVSKLTLYTDCKCDLTLNPKPTKPTLNFALHFRPTLDAALRNCVHVSTPVQHKWYDKLVWKFGDFDAENNKNHGPN